MDRHAIGNSASLVSVHINKYLAIREGIVRLHVIAADVPHLAAVRIEILLIWRKCETVRSGYVLDSQCNFAVFEHKNAGKVQLLRAILVARPHSAKPICKVDGSVLLNNKVVCAAESFSFIAVSQYGARAVVFHPIDRAARPGSDKESTLPVERETVRTDHKELVLSIRVRLRHTHSPDVISGIATVVQI